MTKEEMLEFHGKIIGLLFQAQMIMSTAIREHGLELLTLRSALKEKHIVTGDELVSMRDRVEAEKEIDLTLDPEMQKARKELKAELENVLRLYREEGLEPPFSLGDEEGRG